MTQELDAELIAINQFFYDWLHLDFDLDDIKASRIQIAKILKEHEQEGKRRVVMAHTRISRERQGASRRYSATTNRRLAAGIPPQRTDG